jgi:predicted DNA-binding ribbon-helix-helix protein
MKKDGKLPDKTKYSNSTMTLVSYRVQRWQIAKILNFKSKLKINILINKLYSIKNKVSGLLSAFRSCVRSACPN